MLLHFHKFVQDFNVNNIGMHFTYEIQEKDISF